MSVKASQHGFTLIELIIAIVVIGVGVAGVMVAFMTTVRGSADALVGKQLIAVAEGMMEEILLKPYTPPTGSTAAGATGFANCGDTGSVRTNFDEVSDYNNYQTPSICGIDGSAISGLTGYSMAVTVQSETFGGIPNTLHVRVTASRGGQSVVLDGFRTNYASL